MWELYACLLLEYAFTSLILVNEEKEDLSRGQLVSIFFSKMPFVSALPALSPSPPQVNRQLWRAERMIWWPHGHCVLDFCAWMPRASRAEQRSRWPGHHTRFAWRGGREAC